MATLRTTLHHYSFPSGEHPAYKAMCERIKANAEGRGQWMNAIPMKDDWRREPEGERSEVVEIETDHIFSNQFNTADGRRVFDWYEAYLAYGNARPPRKVGHWVEITPEIAAARRDTHKCGYCGKLYGPYHTPAPADGFCAACLDSPYLKPEDLKLLRLRRVVDDGPPFKDTPELTEEERAALMPRYVERQTTGADSRAKKARDKQRADVIEKTAKAIDAATEKREGMLWLLDQGINLDNVIYYEHTRKFCFGWRQPVSAEVKSKLLDLLCEFGHAYEIKSTAGDVNTTD